jgi:hypothetical protein
MHSLGFGSHPFDFGANSLEGLCALPNHLLGACEMAIRPIIALECTEKQKCNCITTHTGTLAYKGPILYNAPTRGPQRTH